MGIRFSCPNGHKLNVKTFLAGKRGVCPQCGAKFVIPAPVETLAASPAKPRGIVETHYEEIAAPSLGESSTVDLAPSIVIDIADSEAIPTDIGSGPADVFPQELAQQASPAALPFEAPLPSILGIAPAPISPESPTQPRPERSRWLPIVLSVLLFVLVIGLAITFVWVLRRNSDAASKAQSPVTDHSGTRQDANSSKKN